MRKRERWGTKIGLILAMAGNAIGLGNFLRFPVQAAENGGGAFMIPYFISFLLVGLPVMWVEWTIGRRGGVHGHGSAPGAYESVWNHPLAKYLGVMGVLFPLLIVTYYAYIESWCLGYSVLSLVGAFPKVPITQAGDPSALQQVLAPFSQFLVNYIGKPAGEFLQPSGLAYFFFLVTLALNIWVLSRGVVRGIELLAKVAIPLLFVMAVVLVVRVFTLGAPVSPEFTPLKGLAFLWEPQWGALKNPQVWLAAAGQIFFTLSLGFGAIITYASYLSQKDDIALSGLATASANEFAEVVLGASVAIPAAVAFFGIAGAQEIAKGGAFNLGFVTLPAIFSNIPGGSFFGALWFGLLFFAGITSSVALSQPVIAFLEDELGWSKRRAAYTLGLFLFVMTHLVIFLKGALDEIDFWAGTFGLVFGAFVEVILLMWLFKGDPWEELHLGAKIRVPRVFYYIAKYITPLFLGVILLAWFSMDIAGPAIKVIVQEGFGAWFRGFIGAGLGVWAARVYMLVLLAVFLWLINLAWKRRRVEDVL